MSKNLYSLGLMSGTSMDGIDASIIKSDGEKTIEVIDNMYLMYSASVKLKLKKLVNSCNSKNSIKKLSKRIKKIENEITIKYASISKQILKKNKRINVNFIGLHGQTILHKPKQGISLQIGNSKLLSRLTKKTVISDFRTNDILNGGQGAPLTPLYHKIILSKIKTNLPAIIVNIGGISNITLIKKNKKILSFDTGPGNYLIDKWVKKKLKVEFDNLGMLARAGKVNNKILKKLLRDPYYKKKYPKSLDVKKFNLNDLKKISIEDGCATLSMLTVVSICSSIKSLNIKPKNIIFCGGGRKNNFIIENIKKILKKPVKLIDEFNFNGDFIESQAFAFLAIRSFLNKYISLPEMTGVKKPCLGGKIFKATI
jgi:anhydro-N-acetylmuramic acid kinase